MIASTGPSAPLRAAVIGAGRIAHEHLLLLTGATRFGDVSARVRPVAVCDRSRAAAEFIADRYGSIAAYTDVATMLEAVRPDAVHVLTEPPSHVALVAQSLEAGANVICEKPIAPCRRELDELLQVASQSGRWMVESQNYRFNEPVVAVREAVTSGRLGSVTEVEIRINLPITDPAEAYGDPHLPSSLHLMPAGVIHDFITHLVYLLLDLAPSVEYDTIRAEWNAHGDSELFRYDDLDALLIGTGPTGAVHARLRFDSRSGPDMFQVVVRGSDGHAVAEIFHPSVRIVRPRAGGSKLSPLVNQLVNGVGSIRSGFGLIGQRLTGRGTFDGLHRMLDLVYRAVADGRALPVSERDMIETSALVDRLLGVEAGR